MAAEARDRRKALPSPRTKRLYLASEEGLSPGATVLIVDEFEQKEVEERDQRSHAEPEQEGQPGVLLGHVVFVSQDGLDVQRVPQVLQVRQVGGDVQQRGDGLGHHHGEGVALHLRRQLHRLVQAARLAGVQLAPASPAASPTRAGRACPRHPAAPTG